MIVRIEGFKLHYQPVADFRFMEQLREAEKAGTAKPGDLVLMLLLDGKAVLTTYARNIPSTRSYQVARSVLGNIEGLEEWHNCYPITVKQSSVRWIAPHWVEAVVTKPGGLVWQPWRGK